MKAAPIFGARGLQRAWAAVVCGGALVSAAALALAADRPTVLRNETGYVVSTQSIDPPARVGRLASVVGQVWIYSPEEGEWFSAERNRPLTTGDRIATESASRAELRIGSTLVRIDSQTELEVQLLDDERIHLRLHQGSSVVRLRDHRIAAQFELFTTEGRFRTERAGRYRFDQRGPDGDEHSFATVWSGQLRYEGYDQALTVRRGERAEFVLDSRNRAQYGLRGPERDEFAAWNSSRDRGEPSTVIDERTAGQRYVSPEMTGEEDLDRYGRWQQDADHGVVWYPRDVPAGWAPYSTGRWAWVQPWGWTWVDQAPWGFAPFHYGRWVHRGNVWGWAPGAYQARPVYAPGLVGWVGEPPPRRPGVDISIAIGDGSALGWFPLGPYDPYVPGYRHHPRHDDDSHHRFEHDRDRDDPRHHGRDDRRGDDRRRDDRQRPDTPHYINRDAPNAVTMLPPVAQDRRVQTPMRTGDTARDAGNQRRWITPRVQQSEPLTTPPTSTPPTSMPAPAVLAPTVRDDSYRSHDGRHPERRDPPPPQVFGQPAPQPAAQTAPQVSPRFDPKDRRIAR